MRLAAACVAAFIALPSLAEASDVSKAICFETESAMNSVVDYTTTSCLPVDDTKHQGTSLIVISSVSIFSVETAKKAWLLALVGFVGKSFNDRPKFPAGILCVSDENLTKQKIAFSIPISVVKQLQRKVFIGKIELNEMYKTITKTMKSDRCKG